MRFLAVPLFFGGLCPALADECQELCLQLLGTGACEKGSYCQDHDICHGLFWASAERTSITTESPEVRGAASATPVLCSEARERTVNTSTSASPTNTGTSYTVQLGRQTTLPTTNTNSLDFTVSVRPIDQKDPILSRLSMDGAIGAFFYDNSNGHTGGADFCGPIDGEDETECDVETLMFGLPGHDQSGIIVERRPASGVGVFGSDILGQIPIGYYSDFARTNPRFLIKGTGDPSDPKTLAFELTTFDTGSNPDPSHICSTSALSSTVERAGLSYSAYAQAFRLGLNPVDSLGTYVKFTTNNDIVFHQNAWSIFLQLLAGKGMTGQYMSADPFGRTRSDRCSVRDLPVISLEFNYSPNNFVVHILPEDYVYSGQILDNGSVSPDGCTFRITKNHNPNDRTIYIGAPFFASNAMFVDASGSGRGTLQFCPIAGSRKPIDPPTPAGGQVRVQATAKSHPEDTVADFVVHVEPLIETQTTTIPMLFSLNRTAISYSVDIGGYVLNRDAAASLGLHGYEGGWITTGIRQCRVDEWMYIGGGSAFGLPLVVDKVVDATHFEGFAGWIEATPDSWFFAANQEIVLTYPKDKQNEFSIVFDPAHNFNPATECAGGNWAGAPVCTQSVYGWSVSGSVAVASNPPDTADMISIYISTAENIVLSDVLFAQFKSALPPGATFDALNRPTYAACPSDDHFPTISVKLGIPLDTATTLSISPADYVLRSLSGACTVRVRGNTESGSTYILGVPFIKNHNVDLSVADDHNWNVRVCQRA